MFSLKKYTQKERPANVVPACWPPTLKFAVLFEEFGTSKMQSLLQIIISSVFHFPFLVTELSIKSYDKSSHKFHL